MGPVPADVAATFCATLVDEWARQGITDAVVCPGSRSTPLALALADEGRIRVHVVIDERSAAFLALGLGLASGRPAVVLTTSGTAAVELHPAVVEAHQAGVPLVVVTADRPPELRDTGAPQAVDQTHLFGRAVRWFHDPGVPSADAAAFWRPLAARAALQARGTTPDGAGPVHLNLPFREPLVGTPGDLPDPIRTGSSTVAGFPDIHELADLDLLAPRGVIVLGGARHTWDVHHLSAVTGWPVLTDVRARGEAAGATDGAEVVVGAADAILRHDPTARALQPDVVLWLGPPPVSKVLDRWVVASGATEVRAGSVAWSDPGARGGIRLAAPVDQVVAAIASRWKSPGMAPDAGWSDRWRQAEAAAQAAIDEVLVAHPEPTEPGVARTVLAAQPERAALVVAASMPLRDLEWYGRPRRGVAVAANRGANGIDGVVSTAVGVALDGGHGPTTALVGDLAFLHDSNALIGLARRDVDLTVVVVDNDGGGIFSFLPQRHALDDARFEQLFGTPQGVDLAALAAVHGLPVSRPDTMADLGAALDEARQVGGARVVHVRTDRGANVAVHDEVHDAVAAALPPA